MKVQGTHYRSLWFDKNESTVNLIDQNQLPFSFSVIVCRTWQESCDAITRMNVRGAGAIGVMAGYAMLQATLDAPEDNRLQYLAEANRVIEATRPTAHDLFYSVAKVYDAALISNNNALAMAESLASDNEQQGKMIGVHGQSLIGVGATILTHCNAGWLAFVDYGSALAPIYLAHQAGIKFTVVVSETRPRNQGARLTAWELGNEQIDHYIITDSAAASLMQQGKINLVITGADRIAINGDVVNKIGTLDKAILAKEFGIPFYVASPLSTFDVNTNSGRQVTIEYRNPDELLYITGNHSDPVRVASPGSRAINPGFDVTPAEYVTAYITPVGIIPLSKLKTFLREHIMTLGQ